MKRQILIIEDSASLARTYQGFLVHSGFDAHVAPTGARALEWLTGNIPNLILLDLGLPDVDGMEILESLQSGFANIPVVVITANASLRVAVQAMRQGALDYLVKPFDRTRLIATIENALERSNLRKAASRTQGPKVNERPGGMIGESRVMQAIYHTLDGVAASDASVFITGESGTGKELAARAVHERSRRADKTFHAINCGAIPPDLMESELFGHVKGSFSGATYDRDGAASVADGGTLFLDEIGEMPLQLQAKLLRFVQLGAFQKVGETKTRHADIRFVCATNRSPLEAIERGLLREDLYYRLNVIPIEMPPLRERGDDVVLIAEVFLERFSRLEGKNFTGIAEDARQLLNEYNWPGNVRQLENVIRNAVVLQDDELLRGDMLPRSLMQASNHGGNVTQIIPTRINPQQVRPLSEVERDAIEHAIESTGGNIQKAAQLLEIDPSTIHRRRKSWQAAS